jgi:hypothetical protein
LPIITDAVTSEYRYESGSIDFELYYEGSYYGSASYYGTSSYANAYFRFTGSLAQVQDYIPTGIANHRFNGSKLTCKDFNINTTQTVDGGPVVEWRAANGNQLIYQNNGEQGSFRLV